MGWLSTGCRNVCVPIKCCLTLRNQSFWSECTRGWKQVRRGQRGQPELLMWVGHFWGPLQGALSQYIDIQGFDPLTTGMSPGLRQPCLSVLYRAEKPGGPPAPLLPLHGCHGEQISPAALCHTHVGSFSLSSSLSFLSLTFYRAASPRGLPKSAFCPLTMPGVSWTSPYIYSVKKSRLWKSKDFSSENTWQQICFPSVLGSERGFYIQENVWSGSEYTVVWEVQVTANHISNHSWCHVHYYSELLLYPSSLLVMDQSQIK